MKKFILLLILALSLCSCTKKEWWIGTWHLDKAHSEFKNKNLSNSLLGGIAETMVYAIFDNADLVITKDQVMLTRNGIGTAKPLKVINYPSENTVVLQTGDQINTYSYEDGFMITTTAGTPDGMKFYFKKAEQGAAANP